SLPGFRIRPSVRAPGSLGERLRSCIPPGPSPCPPPGPPSSLSLGGGGFFGQPLRNKAIKNTPRIRQYHMHTLRVLSCFFFHSWLFQARRPSRTSIISPPTSQFFHAVPIFPRNHQPPAVTEHNIPTVR